MPTLAKLAAEFIEQADAYFETLPLFDRSNRRLAKARDESQEKLCEENMSLHAKLKQAFSRMKEICPGLASAMNKAGQNSESLFALIDDSTRENWRTAKPKLQSLAAGGRASIGKPTKLEALAKFAHKPENCDRHAKEIARLANVKKVFGLQNWNARHVSNARSNYPKP